MVSTAAAAKSRFANQEMSSMRATPKWRGTVTIPARDGRPSRRSSRSTALEVHLLGPPEILVDGHPMKVDTRKAVALLAYLAVTGTPHNRDVLATLLWPGDDPDRATRQPASHPLDTEVGARRPMGPS